MPSNRTTLIAGNWKMNNDVAAAAKLADELAQALPEVPAGVEVLVCPPTIDITTVHDRIQAAPIALGAQNVYWEEKGAFTGESSCDMLKSAGCTYCIIGHSERRDYFHAVSYTHLSRLLSMERCCWRSHLCGQGQKPSRAHETVRDAER